MQKDGFHGCGSRLPSRTPGQGTCRVRSPSGTGNPRFACGASLLARNILGIPIRSARIGNGRCRLCHPVRAAVPWDSAAAGRCRFGARDYGLGCRERSFPVWQRCSRGLPTAGLCLFSALCARLPARYFVAGYRAPCFITPAGAGEPGRRPPYGIPPVVRP